MNYLAHFYLADANGDSLIGQLLGDFVKGSPDRRYGAEIRAAIRFHRRMDTFTDHHPVVRTSRRRFSPQRRRFAGVMVDLCHDHFLARHWHRFSNEHLGAFTRRVYAELKRTAGIPLPERLGQVLSHMIANDWLGQYRHLERVGYALDRIAGRLTRGECFMGSVVEIKSHYAMLENDFERFFPDMISFARDYRENQCEAERTSDGNVHLHSGRQCGDPDHEQRGESI
ncbi:MAG: DUF479 domain-containing protein [Desulfatitalea sp.]|nr:DUF479 domain-containing protein [Desulfatitalea sp.]